MANRQKRKRRQRAATGAQPQEPPPPSRSELKDAEARAALEPLKPGERPTPVTVGAIVAGALGIVNIGLYVAGFEIDGERPQAVGVLAFSALMLTAAWGMWKVRYWAVLGMQTLLGITLILAALSLISVNEVGAALILLVILAAAGALFWFLVKAMARIQMPERPTRAR